MTAAVATAPPATRSGSGGRTRITARALERIVAAVTGDQLGVDTKSVDIRLADHGGGLDLAVHAPIRVVSIGRLQEDPRALARLGGSVLDRCARAEEHIRSEVHTLTGYTIQRVTVRLTDVLVQQERRVR